MFKYLLLLFAGFGLCFILTPLVRWIALRIGALDIPDSRKVHDHPVPRLGGVAIFASFNLTLVVSLLAAHNNSVFTISDHWYGEFLLASGIIVIAGVFDDVRPLGARIKFLTQTLGALVAVYFGYSIDDVALPFGKVWHLGIWSIPITVLWIVGLTNAFNLIDGLDGLASGVALISTLTLAGVALLSQQVELALVASALAGCLFAFLRYNFRPASIFLGDSGSMFLGFTLAVLSIRTAHKATAAASMLIMILAFGLPIMDTFLAMLRRFLRAAHLIQNNGQGGYHILFLRGRCMFEADKDHIHHRLMKIGLNHKNAVLVLYGICALAGFVAVSVAAMRDANTGLMLIAFGFCSFIAIQKLRYQEFSLIKSRSFLPVVKLSILRYEPFQILVDMVMIIASCYFAWLLHVEGRFDASIKACIIATIPILLLTKLVVFYVAGLYRIKWLNAGVRDFVVAARSVVLGSIVSAAMLSVFASAFLDISVVIIDMLISGVLLLGPRFAGWWVQNASSSAAPKKNVVIYGAGRNAGVLLKELLSNGETGMAPIGFIDDDPEKQHKTVHGLPVLGPYAQIDEIVPRTGAKEIILACNGFDPAKMNELTGWCKQHGVVLRQLRLSLENVGLVKTNAVPIWTPKTAFTENDEIGS